MVQCRCERHTHTDWSIEGRDFKTRELTIEAFAQGATPRGQRDRVNQPYQDRHLMNTQPPFGKAARRARRSSTGHGGMRLRTSPAHHARLPPLEAFGRRPPEHAAPSIVRPASETLHRSGNRLPGHESVAILSRSGELPKAPTVRISALLGCGENPRDCG